MEEALKIALEHYDIIFLYGLKYLKDIKENLAKHHSRIERLELKEEFKKEYSIN